MPCVDEAGFERLHRQHEEALGALDRLEAALEGGLNGPAPFLQALDEFLSVFDRVVAPHMAAEEQDLYPLLDRCVPPEVGSAEAMLREHETMRSLVALLRRGRERLARQASDAEVEALTAAQDFTLLLREHIRKEEHVVNPLLRRLLLEARPG